MSMLMRLAAGSALQKNYVDDVFSTFLYTGNGTSQTITNGIDLAGKGGLVWIKQRSGSVSHTVFDTARGAQQYLLTTTADIQQTDTQSLTSFSSSGFSVGNQLQNSSSQTYVAWTFRKAAKFLDIVTYTGDGTASRSISHNLGIQPGFVIIKSTNATGDWSVFARAGAADGRYFVGGSTGLNFTATPVAGYNGTSFTAAGITATAFNPALLSGATPCNINGVSYVAYLFAHDSAADGMIQCSSLTTSASAATYTAVNLGWEPQWLLIKNTTTSGNWQLIDTARGLNAGGNVVSLFPNAVTQENSYSNVVRITATGFEVSSDFLGTSQTLIYMAVRRNNKPPTSGTSVFDATTNTGNTAAAGSVYRQVDLMVNQDRDGANWAWADRLRGLAVLGSNVPVLLSNSSGAELTTTLIGYFDNNGGYSIDASRTPPIGYVFRRAPGFFDVVCYSSGVGVNVSHSLGVIPELIIAKSRTATGGWTVQYGGNVLFDANSSAGLNSSAAAISASAFGNRTSSLFRPDASVVANGSMVAYLFASLPGISKVGTYTGNGGTVNTNGTSQTINCGFTAGARFILIKRTDASGDWYVFDTARGIVAGSDPYLVLNSSVAEVTTADVVDPASAGFIVNQTATENLNVTSATYLYLAIA